MRQQRNEEWRENSFNEEEYEVPAVRVTGRTTEREETSVSSFLQP